MVSVTQENLTQLEVRIAKNGMLSELELELLMPKNLEFLSLFLNLELALNHQFALEKLLKSPMNVTTSLPDGLTGNSRFSEISLPLPKRALKVSMTKTAPSNNSK